MAIKAPKGFNRITRQLILAKGSWLKLDLLRRRREQLDLDAPKVVAERSLLWRGGLVGGGLVFVVLLACFGAWLYGSTLEERKLQLASAVADYESDESLLIQGNQELKSLQNGNKSMAEGIAGLKSGSALLTEISRLTPQTVQLTKIKALPKRLELAGVANQPKGLYVVNAFQLRLSDSSFFQPEGISLIKAVEMGSKQVSVKPGAAMSIPDKELRFDINAVFLPDSAQKLTPSRLQALGSRGLADRLELLNNEGLLR